MTDTVFCYHCRTRHPQDEVRKIATKSGLRWRCIKSIVATRTAVHQREEFGRQTTASNRARDESAKRQSLPLCVTEPHPLAHTLQTVLSI